MQTVRQSDAPGTMTRKSIAVALCRTNKLPGSVLRTGGFDDGLRRLTACMLHSYGAPWSVRQALRETSWALCEPSCPLNRLLATVTARDIGPGFPTARPTHFAALRSEPSHMPMWPSGVRKCGKSSCVTQTQMRINLVYYLLRPLST